MQVGTKKWCLCVTLDGPAANRRPASIVRVPVYCVCLVVHTYTTTPLFTVIMTPKRKSSDAGSASKPKKSRDVLSISEKVKILDMIVIKKKSYAEIARLYARTNLPFVK